jgi:RES domain-containing protein
VDVFRLIKEKHQDGAFSGRGSAEYPGRWNKEGEHIVYCSASLSLAALEILCHAGRRVKTLSYCYFQVTVPDDWTIDSPNQLPDDWNSYPTPNQTQEIGSKWYQESDSNILEVPSVHSPVENNYLIRANALSTNEYGDSYKYRFDPRLYEDEATE